MSTQLRALASAVIALLILGAASSVTAASKPNPTINVSPSSGLTDGQPVQVSGQGWQEQAIEIAECGGADLAAHPSVGPVCTYFTHSVDVQSDADGNFSAVDFDVAATIVGTRYVHGNHPVTATYDCTAANDCYIRAYSLTKATQSATVPISFAP